MYSGDIDVRLRLIATQHMYGTGKMGVGTGKWRGMRRVQEEEGGDRERANNLRGLILQYFHTAPQNNGLDMRSRIMNI